VSMASMFSVPASAFAAKLAFGNAALGTFDSRTALVTTTEECPNETRQKLLSSLYQMLWVRRGCEGAKDRSVPSRASDHRSPSNRQSSGLARRERHTRDMKHPLTRR
jgi:hypothetical protein